MDITDSCLDAETAAAWADGGLAGAELERVRTHVADCARCQALMGTLIGISAPVGAVSLPEAAPRRWFVWLAPLTAAAAAVAIWLAVPRSALDQRSPVGPTSQAAPSEAPSVEKKVQAPPPVARTDSGQPMGQSPAAAPQARRQETLSSGVDSLSKQAPSQTPMAADSAASAPAAPTVPGRAKAGTVAAPETASLADRRASFAPLEIVSPDPMVRWRLAGAAVEHSTNGGAAWEVTQPGVTSELTAGASPSRDVCWVVGRGGVVLLSTDGRTWIRVPFPEITDLSAIRARDARSASVTTADGRVFSTTTSGTAWVPGPLQGF